MTSSPLRLSSDRIVLYGALLALLCAIQVRFVAAQRFGDWSAFWAAGSTAGTSDLLDPRRHAAWQIGHHLLTTIFPYLPGFAWLYVPSRPLSLAEGYALNFVTMLISTVCAAFVAARLYRVSRGVALALSFAWAPVIAAMATGQNAALGLLLETIAISAIVADSWAACGIAVGLLLYKLPYALPLVALLAVRRNWRALAVVAGCALAWYVASAAATAWDWHWPAHYADALRGYAAADAQFNAVKAVSVPQLLSRAGLPQTASMLAGAALFVSCLPLLRRWPVPAAASFAPLLGLAFGPHTLPYDLTLALPAIFYAGTRFGEPLRTRLICVIYVVAPFWLLSGVLHFDVLALVCEGMVAVWLIHDLMNPRLAGISASLIREIAAKRKPSSIDLGLGEPSLSPAREHLEAGMRHALEHGLRYTVNAGDPHLRGAIAAHYAYPQMDKAENVCITTGSQEATYAVIKTILDPSHDELLVVEPAFPSYAKMAALEGIAVRTVSLREEDDFAFDPQLIAHAVTAHTRMIVICSPCNPTARVITEGAVRELSRTLTERGGDPVWVLHDEIYREQTFVDDAGYFARHYPHTIVTNSVSKSNALTGLRLGWAIAPNEIAAQIVKVHAWLTSCADSFAQQVALHVFTTPGALAEHAQWYALQRERVIGILNESGLRYISPDGAFYACVRIPQALDSLDAAHSLADRYDVIAVPGVAFGAAFKNWLRLTWVSEPERLREGLGRIAAFLREKQASVG